jgi:hypothetical protein
MIPLFIFYKISVYGGTGCTHVLIDAELKPGKGVKKRAGGEK